MTFSEAGMKVRQEVGRATTYVDRKGQEKRAPDKVAFVVGVACFAFIFVNAWAFYYVGVLLGDSGWSDVSGFYTYIAAFTGSTFVPFIVRGWRAGRGENDGDGGDDA